MAGPEFEVIEAFDSPRLSWRGREPQGYEVDGDGALTITPEPKQDYWRLTFYSPPLLKADGPGYLASVPGAAEATLDLTLTLDAKHQFDQAGALVRVDEACWAKCGLERVDGETTLSVVVTNGFSDWSTSAWPSTGGAPSVDLRIHKLRPGAEQGSCLVVEAKAPSDEAYRFVRAAPVADGGRPWHMGPFCFAPAEGGCTATFRTIRLGPKQPLAHAQSEAGACDPDPEPVPAPPPPVDVDDAGYPKNWPYHNEKSWTIHF